MFILRLVLVAALLCAMPSMSLCGNPPSRCRVVGPVVGEPWLQFQDALEKKLFYFVDLNASAQIFARIQLDEEFKKHIESRDKKDPFRELVNKGGASVFLSETAKFAESLRKDKFSKVTLAIMYLDTEDENPPFLSARLPSRPEGPFQSRLLFAGDRAEEDTPAALSFLNHRPKDPKDKIPVTVHCSFVFLAQGKGTASIKTLCFDLFLEEVKIKKGTLCCYPWKVKNVQYK